MDHKLYKRFFVDVLPDDEKTATEGRPCFRNVEMITIMVPGDKNNIVTREAREEDKTRFADLYAKFKKGEGEILDGFPLKEWTGVTRAQVEELKFFNFLTVESLANANDNVAVKFPGLHELKRRAAAWVQAQKDSAPIEKLNAEIKARDEQNAALQAQMAEMVKALAELKAQVGKK
jgi:hypothetical protein